MKREDRQISLIKSHLFESLDVLKNLFIREQRAFCEECGKQRGRRRNRNGRVSSGGKFHFNYSFWVRGHFRQLKSDRYSKKKRIFIAPYIKGEGVLVDKLYSLNRREEK